MRTLVWFRGKDLRIADHTPLLYAVQAGEVIPLFVLDPYFFAPARAHKLPHRMQFLLESLAVLRERLAELGSRLILVHGKSTELVPHLAKKWRVDQVVAHRWVEPFGRERDCRIGAALSVPFRLYEGETLLPPGTLRTGAGTPYAVYTQFARAFARTARITSPCAAPSHLPPLPTDIEWEAAELPTCESLGIVPNPAILRGGEAAATQRLQDFLRAAAAAYAEDRDRLDRSGTSRLSADLKFGTISVRTVWKAVERALPESRGAQSFKNELVWREFSHSTLWDRPELLAEPFRPQFIGFPWRKDEASFSAWAAGQTGYPVVDAAARQLLAEGFVHNRARMIAASFLTKHLLIDYRHGEAHYMKYLTDGDWAQNNAGWQWSAGTGCDAQPYFRIFNPIIQGQRFDPDGKYVRRYVPALARLPIPYIHSPWLAPETVLREAGVRLGEDYPRPIIDHQYGRDRFLAVAARHLEKKPHSAKVSPPEPHRGKTP